MRLTLPSPRSRPSETPVPRLRPWLALAVALAIVFAAAPTLRAQEGGAGTDELAPNERPLPGTPSAELGEDRIDVRPLLQDQLGGASFSVDADGPLAALGVGLRLHVLELTEEGPRLLAQTPILDSLVRAVALDGDLAFVGLSDAGGIRVFDLSEPTAPREIASFPTAGEVRNFDLSREDRVYTAVLGGLRALERLPDGGFEERPIDLPFRSVIALRVLGDHLYVLEPSSGLHAVDLSGEREEPVATLPLDDDLPPDATADIVVLGDDRLLVVVGSSLHLIDVSEPDAPALLGSATQPGLGVDAAVDPEGAALAVANLDGGVRLFDVSDPRAVRETRSIDSEQGVSSVVWSDLGLLWTDWLTGLRVSDGAAGGDLTPRAFYRPTSFADGIAVADDRTLYATGAMAGVDTLVRDDAGDSLRWQAESPLGPGVRSTRVRSLPGGQVLVVGPHGGVWLKREESQGEGLSGGAPLTLAAHDGLFSEEGDRVFVAGGFDGFHELAREGDRLRRTASLPTSSFVGALDREGDLVALASRDEGLLLVDVATPGAPQVLARQPAAGAAMDVLLRDGQAHLITQNGLLETFDLADASAPRSISVVPLGGGALRLDEEPGTDLLYALVDESTLVPIRVEPGAEPRVGKAYAYPERLHDFALEEGRAWAGAGRYGFLGAPLPFEERAQAPAMPTPRPSPAPTSEAQAEEPAERRRPFSARFTPGVILAILGIVALAALAIGLVVRAGLRPSEDDDDDDDDGVSASEPDRTAEEDGTEAGS